ncbi:hypothetical protein RJ527_13435 [Thalassospiraceae bacterium LMO-SO8]|nr:hypothetical protein [Alphaproteobacteria bacterium LMO-S08]WND75039.1 hypothetical protein RJ527_13435 [Thalassospiraceae bacterium LMO-SO8]
MYVQLWRRFQSMGLADAHFVSDVVRGDEGKFWERIWEMLLAQHLIRQRHTLCSTNQGPDFKLEYNGQTIWIEAISPRPTGLPEDWLKLPEPGVPRVRSFPHEGILLRWTSAIKEKRDKLEGRRVSTSRSEKVAFGYRQNGHVGEMDSFVIAVNGSRLSLSRDDHGISQLPFAVEAVFPIGPIEISVNVETMEWGEAKTSFRPTLVKKSGAEVSTRAFLDPEFRGVSAVVGCNVSYDIDPLPIIVVHNPLAKNPVPKGIFGAAEEYYLEEAEGDFYRLLQFENG